MVKFIFLKKLGHCELGENCNFAHSELELRSTPDLYKTALCNNFMSGECKLGEYCRFAHGESELRVKQPVCEPCPPSNQNGYFGQQGYNNHNGFNNYNGNQNNRGRFQGNNQRGRGGQGNRGGRGGWQGGQNNNRGGFGNKNDFQQNNGYQQQQQQGMNGMVYAQNPVAGQQQAVQYYMAGGVGPGGQPEGMVVNYAQPNATAIGTTGGQPGYHWRSTWVPTRLSNCAKSKRTINGNAN